MLPEFFLILSKNSCLQAYQLFAFMPQIYTESMTPKVFFDKYKRMIIPFQLRLHKRAFGISNKDTADNAVIPAETFILKKSTDQQKIKALATTLPGHNPKKALRDLLSLQRQCNVENRY